MESRKTPAEKASEDLPAAEGPPAAAGPLKSTDPIALPAVVTLKAMARRAATIAREKAVYLTRAMARLRLRARMRWHPAFAITAVIALVPVAYLAYCIAAIPVSGGSSTPPAPSAMVFEGEDGQPFATRGILKGQSLSADDVPPVVANAVISIEDRRFYQHGGVDLRATARAFWHDLRGGKIEGGSTITQQLARRLYLSPDRTLKRKVQEAMLAAWLELRFSKNAILARYLNTAYFGDGTYGIDSAALRYFGKSARQLTLPEAAMLAGLIRAPSQLEPDRNLAGAQARAGVVLDAMVANGAITLQQADAAQQQPAMLHGAPDSPPGSNYFLDTAATEAKSQIGSSTDDLTIRTTLSPELQRIAESVIAKRFAASGNAKNPSQAALVAMAPDGAILAMVGGRDYGTSQFNRVTQARRQPGSSFKVFVYLTALRKGYTPDSTMVDQPITIGDWKPDNYGNQYYGPVTLRTAFASSLNSVAVQLAQAVGIQNVIATARQFGVRSDLPAVPSLAIGAAAVTPLEMTRAFAAIATNTTGNDGYTVRAITEGSQSIYARPAPALASADNPTIHGEMLDLLTSVVREGTGTAARLDQPVGGKTGTSENYRDAWFIGFTSDLVVGVWVGNDDNTPMDGVTGGSIPASIWHDFVSAAEPARGSQSAAISAAAPSAQTISFAGVAAADGNGADQNGYRNGFGFPLPFRLFGFRF
jgi:penicillin-binding protein 1A